MKITNEQFTLAANTIRCLCSDMIDKANSGHPGAAMGMADLASVLWLKYLNIDPKDPSWAGRDRLVFSGGHASSLVYALFHLAGVGDLSMEELQSFRQFQSRCAGHPERGLMPGVEVTTGPLGQGIAMGIGLALAAKKSALNNRTWVFCGDGDLQEGISHEACSWAGAMKVDNLILVYDSNRITIEGSTSISMADDTAKRFASYGWKVLECDGHDYASIDRAYRKALRVEGQSVIIIASTHIGFGSPNKHDNADCHGAPLGKAETALVKQGFGFDPEKLFYVPQEVYALFSQRSAQQHRLANRAKREAKASGAAVPKVATKDELLASLPKFDSSKNIATRSACGEVMNALSSLAPELIGGSADLGPSNKTILKGAGDIVAGDFSGRNIHFGIREIAMTAIVNGISAFGSWRGYGATFFVFSDYCRPAIRLAALMKVPSIHIFSHDSFYVGEDGPTHEPIEQLAAMRTIPGLALFRPADANETAYAWVAMLLNLSSPSCLLTTRQDVPVLSDVTYEGVSRGGYIIWQAGRQDENTTLFIASGSEVSIAIEAAKKLWDVERRSVRVVSMPSQGLFLAQSCAYRESIVPEYMTRRVIVEAASRFGWDRFRLDHKKTVFVTKDDFGASAPYKVLAKEYGFTAENVYEKARAI